MRTKCDPVLRGNFVQQRPGVCQPKRVENAQILIANTPKDTDKIKVLGSTIKVYSMAKISNLEMAEKKKNERKFCLTFAMSSSTVITPRSAASLTVSMHFTISRPSKYASEHAEFHGI